MASSKKTAVWPEHPPELRERAVRMVFEVRRQTGQSQGSIARVARDLGVGAETRRDWVRRAGIDGGAAGRAHAAAQRMAELERENRELRRATTS